MATYTRIATANGDISASSFRTVLEDSGLFTTVERDGYYDINCYIGENKFINFQFENSGHTGKTTVYTQGGTVTGSASKGHWYMDAYQCSGGLIIICKENRIVLTTNQDGETVIICGNITSSTTTIDTIMATMYAMKYTDAVTPIPYTTNQVLAKQTMLMPVCTSADPSSVSYTEKAKFATYAEYRTVGNIYYNGIRYFYDGYFAVEDELTT
jgi:hypothetical protein